MSSTAAAFSLLVIRNVVQISADSPAFSFFSDSGAGQFGQVASPMRTKRALVRSPRSVLMTRSLSISSTFMAVLPLLWVSVDHTYTGTLGPGSSAVSRPELSTSADVPICTFVGVTVYLLSADVVIALSCSGLGSPRR
ncbi:hypothetical protein ACFYSH_20175 [Streptomyces sp. NPDC005791]|uniref:hypothetical protein n=1 Tax=Streptomyces sp. NPDC005791 TaxID=3364732 RepID=UPI0036A45C73